MVWTTRRLPSLVLLGGFLWGVLVPGAAWAGGFAVPEIGTRKTAMGAMIGRPDDLSAIYHNPAGLVLSPGLNIYVNTGLSLPTTNMRVRPWPRSDEFLSEPVTGGYYPEAKPSRAFGVIPMIVISSNVLSERAVMALSIYVPNAVGAAFPEDSVLRYHLIDSYIVSGFSTLSVAYKLTDWLAVGAGLSLIYVRLKGERFLFPILHGVDLSGLFGKKSRLELGGEDLTAGFNLGVLLRPFPSLTIGAAVISRSDFSLEGDIKLTVNEGKINENTIEGRQKTQIVVPWTFQFGINWDVTRWVEVGAELRYYTYSQFKEQRTIVEGIPLIKELLTPKNYRDSMQVSGGVKVRLPMLPRLELMAGMHFDRTPAPDNTVSAEQPTFNHIGIHGGARYLLGHHTRIALTYAHYFYLERSTSESLTDPPSNFTASGQNNIMSLVLEFGFFRPAWN